MNKTTVIVGGVVVTIAIIAITGGYLYQNRNGGTNPIATTFYSTNPTSSVGNNETTTTKTGGVPTVSTSPNVSLTDTTASVTGNISPRGSFTSYWYEYGLTSNLGSKTSSQNVGSGFNSVSAPSYISGLTKNTLYYFRLIGENSAGRSSGVIYTFKTTEGKPTPVGTIPTIKTIAASGISRTTANLKGEVTPNKADTQYWFEYGQTTKLGNASALSSAGSGSTKIAVSISLSDLDPITTYYFRLNAQNQFGTINGSILNFKTLGPAAITAKAPTVTTGNATSISSSGATLHGKVNPNLAETNYWFEYSSDSQFGSALLKSTAVISTGAVGTVISTDKVITGLASSTTYYFHLVARNRIGTTIGDRKTFKTNK